MNECCVLYLYVELVFKVVVLRDPRHLSLYLLLRPDATNCELHQQLDLARC